MANISLFISDLTVKHFLTLVNLMPPGSNIIRPQLVRSRKAIDPWSFDIFEPFVSNSVTAPVLEIEVPPFRVVNRETFGLHCIA